LLTLSASLDLKRETEKNKLILPDSKKSQTAQQTQLPESDGQCVQNPSYDSPRHINTRLLTIPTFYISFKV